MAHDVFISYSSRDKGAADAACHFLEADGIRCWIAPRDIPPGQPWKPQIVQAIRDARVMVLIFSGQANRSPQVKREVDIAFESGHAIVPFRIEDVQMDDEMYYCLAAAHWLDALTDPLEGHLDRLLQAVRLLVDGDSEVAPAGAPPEPAVQAARQTVPATPVPAASGGGKRWFAIAGAASLLLVASVAFGLSWFGGADDPATTGPPTAATIPSAEPAPVDAEPEAQADPGAPDGSSTAPDPGAADPPPAEPPPAPRADPTPTPSTEVVDRGATAPPATSTATPLAPAKSAEEAGTGVIVLIYGNDAGPAAMIETAILQSLSRRTDLRLLDATSLAIARGDRGVIAAANSGDFSALSALGRENGADFLVVGTLSASAAPSVNRFFTGSAVLDLKMYRVSAGALVGAQVLRSGGAGIMAATESDAMARAVSAAAQDAGEAVRVWMSNEMR